MAAPGAVRSFVHRLGKVKLVTFRARSVEGASLDCFKLEEQTKAKSFILSSDRLFSSKSINFSLLSLSLVVRSSYAAHAFK